MDVTLDPDTVHAYCILSDDRKQVRDGNTWQKLLNETTVKRDNKKRSDRCVHVLGKEGFSSGRFYFEVPVKGMTDWTLGVVRESIDRKGKITPCPKNGYWTVALRNGNEYIAHSDLCLRLYMSTVKPQRVGVLWIMRRVWSPFMMWSLALVSTFTPVSLSLKNSIHTCPCLHNEGKNLSPLIITHHYVKM